MIGHVIGFNEINEADIRGEIVIASRIEECFQGEESIPTAEYRGASKLESGAMFVRRKDLRVQIAD